MHIILDCLRMFQSAFPNGAIVLAILVVQIDVIGDSTGNRVVVGS